MAIALEFPTGIIYIHENNWPAYQEIPGGCVGGPAGTWAPTPALRFLVEGRSYSTAGSYENGCATVSLWHCTKAATFLPPVRIHPGESFLELETGEPERVIN